MALGRSREKVGTGQEPGSSRVGAIRQIGRTRAGAGQEQGMNIEQGSSVEELEQGRSERRTGEEDG